MSFASRTARVSVRSMRSIPARGSTRAVFRRNMTSHGHEQEKSSDTPWVIGSAVVFVPTIIYLLKPKKDKKGHGDDDHHHAPSKTESKPAEPMTDDEGTESSGEDINEAMRKAFNTDSPTDAQAAEEEKGDNISDKYDNGAPSQTEEAENTEIEPRSRGYSDSKGTYQNPKDEEPTPTQQTPAGSVVQSPEDKASNESNPN